MAGNNERPPITHSDFPNRLVIDRRGVSEAAEIKSNERQAWIDSLERLESPDGVSCFEQKDQIGQTVGRVWCKASVEVDQVEE